ncbi:MAG TPA: ATP-binding protein [Streptomyces sp.]|nr:ATP-binding protein [Streptomyces sp.]
MCTDHCMTRKSWELSFLAEPHEVAGLRRVMRVHLTAWGLTGLVDTAQLCVSELVTNVINHVGAGTPTTLAVSMRGTNLRIEVQDPDAETRPVRLSASEDAEGGRGMEMVDMLAERWGVDLVAHGKSTWCEIASGLVSSGGHVRNPRVTKAELALTFYRPEMSAASGGRPVAGRVVAEESAITLIADILHWGRAHGRDADDILDRAQMRFEGELADL